MTVTSDTESEPRPLASRPTVQALACIVVLAVSAMSAHAAEQPRPRLRDLGIAIGVHEPGSLNAITDVAGVRVGRRTLIEGERVRTGVTAIAPHGGNLFREKVPGAIVVGNGFGKLMGSTQVQELGEIETPILLTNTLAVLRDRILNRGRSAAHARASRNGQRRP